MREDLVEAYVDRTTGDVLLVDGWWPAALWLGSATCMVRTDEGPDAEVSAQVEGALSRRGMVKIDADLEAPVLAVAMQRVDVIAASWRVWSVDEPTARAAVNQAAAG